LEFRRVFCHCVLVQHEGDPHGSGYASAVPRQRPALPPGSRPLTWHRRCISAAMRIALVLEDDYATRRAIAELLRRDGYGVCEGFQADPIPFVPALAVIVTDVVMRPDIEAVPLW